MTTSSTSPASAAGSGPSLRLARLREEISRREIGAIALSNPINVGYISGFTGSTATAVVTPTEAVFIADFRYALQAQSQCPEFHVRQCGPKPLETLADVVKELGISTLHFESATLTVAALEKWKEALPEITLLPAADVVETLRQVKDAGEIAWIREAAVLADRAFDFLLTITRPGVREIDIAIELEYFLKKQGSEKEAFEIIVASGPRSALPHGRASEKRLAGSHEVGRGEFVTFDFGACRGGYFSDLTRTIVLGKADDRQREVYGIVAAAQQAALEAIRPGATGKEVDAKARDLIAAHGFGENFGHGTGHGLGRLVHDHPGFSVHSELTLAPGMVLTVEPGIYIEGWGGVRIEDDVLVTDTGCEILTSAPKHLIEL